MGKIATNPCTRCGKERIVAKTWKEKIETYSGISVVVHTETICPDKACQALVDKELEVQRKKREKIKTDREQRTQTEKVKLDQLREFKRKENL